MNQFTKVAIHGVPRSGTSWIGEVFNSSPNSKYLYQPLFSYAHKGKLSPSSTTNEINQFFEGLDLCEDTFTNQTSQRLVGKFPQFEKTSRTHVVYKEVRYHNILNNLMQQSDDLYLCVVIRNPLSVINSWLQAPREFRGDLGWEVEEEWRYALKKNMNQPEEYNGYEKWKEASRTFLSLKEQYPTRVHIQKYSTLLEQPHNQAEQMLRFCGLSMSEATKIFLNQSSKNANPDAYSVYRSAQTDSKWKEQLDVNIIEQITADIRDTSLESYLD